MPRKYYQGPAGMRKNMMWDAGKGTYRMDMKAANPPTPFKKKWKSAGPRSPKRAPKRKK